MNNYMIDQTLMLKTCSGEGGERGGGGGQVITREDAVRMQVEKRAARLLGWRREDEDAGGLIEAEWAEDEWFEPKEQAGQADQAVANEKDVTP